MRTLSLSYSTSTGMLSLVNDATVTGNANDNNAITISVTGLPLTYVSAKIEYGVIIENNQSGAYYPFSELVGGTCTIPRRVCRAATSGRLPIGLKITYSNQNVECSANQLIIPLGTWRDSEETMADAFGDQIMMRGSSWEWLSDWTYAEDAIVYYDGQFWMSTEDDNKGHEPTAISTYWSGIGEKGDTGNSISASFEGNTLTITEKDHTGATVDTDTYDMLGDIGISAEFQGTKLKVTTTDYEGHETEAEQDLKGDSLTAMFNGTELIIQQVDSAGVVVDTDQADVKGDSLQATFDGPVLIVQQVKNNGEVVATDSENLLGNGLSAQFSGTTLTVKETKNDGTVVGTTSSDLKGDSLSASFNGTPILTVTQKNAAGQTVATDSQNLLGDSVRASFSGEVLTVQQVNNAGTVVASDSKNLKGDSLNATFDGTTLIVQQVNNAGVVVDSDSQDLKGDSLEASFSGNTLTIDQVNAAGQTVDTDTYDMLGETGISASFTGKVLNVTTKDYAGNETTVSQDVEGPQGIQGEQGPPGIGIPTGGTTGQMLVKKSATDYDTEWVNRDPVVTFYMNITVTASAGTPSLSGIAITATPTSGNTITGTTDASGKCTLSGVQQNTAYTITGAKTNFVVTSASATVIDISTAVSLTCYELPKMTVTVLDPSSVAMSGIPVTIAGTETYTGTTDSNGQYSAYVAVDTYTVSVTVASTQITPTAQSVSAVASGTPTVSFTVHDKPVLTVTVTGGTIAGRTVTATQTGGSVITAVTNAYGTATMILEPSLATSVSVDAQTNYFTPSAYTVTPAQDTTYSHTFAYVAMPVVTVTVTTQTSLSVSGLAIAASMSGQSNVTGTTDANGQCTLVLPAEGTWSIALTTPLDPDQYASDTASVTASGGQTYTATITITSVIVVNYWAVDIAVSNSDPSARCTYPQTITVNGETVDNDAYGFTPMAGSSGGTFTAGSWGSEDIVTGIKPVSSDGASTPTFTDANKDASTWITGTEYFTEFPFYWLSITNDGTKIRIIFSDADTQPDSTFQCYAHAKACDTYTNSDIESAVALASRDAIMSSNNNSYFANAFHVGCFGGNVTSGNLYSKCSNTYTTNVAYAYYWKYANARGGEYDCMSYQQWTYLQALFILLFKSTNSQAAHSNGLAMVDSTSVSSINTNAPLATDTHGMAGKVGVAERMAFFWIHDLWGNYYQFIGGAWNRAQSTVKLYYWLPRQANSRAFNNGWTAATTYATQADMGTDTWLIYTSNGNFIEGVAGTNTGGFAVTNTGGSASTFWCDYGRADSNSSRAGFPLVGGGTSGSIGDSGMFYYYVGSYSTLAYSGYGSRLSFRGGR